MLSKKIDSDAILHKLMDIWKADPINNFKSLLRNLENDMIEIDTPIQKLINQKFMSTSNDKINTQIRLKDEGDAEQDLPSGKEIKKEESDEKEEKNENKEETEFEKTISFTKDVLPYVIPLACILTMKNSNRDFTRMLCDIQENPALLEIFDDMCLVWWDQEGLMDFIRKVVAEYFNKQSNTYNISINFKMAIQSLIDNSKELLELINECLKPKTIEKKSYGEVFTPMPFINDKRILRNYHDMNIYYILYVFFTYRFTNI